MSLHDLSVANAAGRLSFEQAAEYAYRLASRWGGEFVVVEFRNEGSHQVLGRGERSGRAEGSEIYEPVGYVTSRGPGSLKWEWANDKVAPAPASPFEDLPRPNPPQMAIHLEPDVRELMNMMTHVMRIQAAFAGERNLDALRLMRSEPLRAPDDGTVSHVNYLVNARNNGRVEAEIQRLQRTIKAAHDAVDPLAGFRESSDIIFGRKRVPDEAAPEPAGPSR